MNRRGIMQAILTALAVIPGIAEQRPVMALPLDAVGPACPDRPIIRLASVRDLLLPGLYSRRDGSGIELDIQIDNVNDCLLVKGYNTRTKKELGFAITRGSIQDNSFKAQFNPSVVKLIDELKYGPVPQGAVL